MFYSNEIRKAEEHGHTNKTEIKEQERTLAQQLIESLAAPFQPEKYHDTYQDSLQQLIEAKASGRKIAAVPHPARAPVVRPDGCPQEEPRQQGDRAGCGRRREETLLGARSLPHRKARQEAGEEGRLAAFSQRLARYSEPPRMAVRVAAIEAYCHSAVGRGIRLQGPDR